MPARWTLRNMGVTEGSIMATIIASHISTNIAPEANHVCPGMGIHIIDIEQQKRIVAATLTTNTAEIAA